MYTMILETCRSDDNKWIACKEKMDEYARLLSDPKISQELLLTAINVACLVSTLFASTAFPVLYYVPTIYHAYALTYFIPSLMQCKKPLKDLCAVIEARQYRLIPVAVVVLGIQIANPIGTICSPAASLASALSYPLIAGRVLSFLTVGGRIAFAAEVSRDVFSVFLDRYAINTFSQGVQEAHWSYLYLRLRLTYQEAWNHWSANQNATEAVKYLNKLSFYAKMSSLRNALFYPLNALTKCYPNTWIQYSVYCLYGLSATWEAIQKKQMGSEAGS